MLREGGWRPVIIHEGLVFFMDPWGGQLVPLDEALERENSRPMPTGEMLEKVGKGSKIPHDSDTGIPWVFGEPPRPKQESKAARGRRLSKPEMMRNVKTNEETPKNRAHRRRNLQRNG